MRKTALPPFINIAIGIVLYAEILILVYTKLYILVNAMNTYSSKFIAASLDREANESFNASVVLIMAR